MLMRYLIIRVMEAFTSRLSGNPLWLEKRFNCYYCLGKTILNQFSYHKFIKVFRKECLWRLWRGTEDTVPGAKVVKMLIRFRIIQLMEVFTTRMRNQEVGHSEILYSLGLWKGGVLLIVISLPQVHNRLVFVWLLLKSYLNLKVCKGGENFNLSQILLVCLIIERIL